MKARKLEFTVDAAGAKVALTTPTFTEPTLLRFKVLIPAGVIAAFVSNIPVPPEEVIRSVVSAPAVIVAAVVLQTKIIQQLSTSDTSDVARELTEEAESVPDASG